MQNTARVPAICDYEGSSYRTDFWVGKGREYEDRVERIALHKLLPPTGERLVEIGAGYGRLANLYGGYRRIYLVDYAKSQLRQAQEMWGKDERFVFVAANLYHLPFPAGYFDTVVSVRVLHHVQKLPAALSEFGRVLCGGGTYVLEYANKRHLRAMLRYIMKRGKSDENPFSLTPYEFVPLNFDFHPQYIERCLREAGVVVEAERSVSFFRVGFLKRWIPVWLLAGLDGCLQSPLAGLHLAPSQFVRSRPLGDGDNLPRDNGFACPHCGCLNLVEESGALCCTGCTSRWPVEEGLYDFRVRG